MTPSENRLKPTGSLTMKEVPTWHSKTSHPDAVPAEVDLSGVERTDSSALAWLLDLQSRAVTNQSSIAFINPPKALCTLARLSGIEELLGWGHADGSASNTTLSDTTP